MFNNASNIDASHSTFSEVHRDQHVYSRTHVQGNQIVNTIVHGNQVFHGTFGLENLHRASVPGAAFDSFDRHPAPACLPGTRLELLARLTEWIDDPNIDQRICWLSGLAGSGKSAIAQSIAERYAGQRRLAASFFFSRKEILRRKAQGFFPTLACQTLVFSPSIKPALLDALDADAMIPTKVLPEQARRLLQDPIASSNDTFTRPILIVVDSLDECDDGKMANEIVRLLSGILRQCRWPLKALLTSRAEQHIVQTFQHGELQNITCSLRLQDFSVNDDIRAYLRHSFDGILESMNSISIDTHRTPWPSNDEIEVIVQKADGLFIFATTIVKQVGMGSGSPVTQLQPVLKALRDGTNAENLSVHSSLDMLYLDALRSIQDVEKVRLTLGSVVFAFRPLSTRGLNDLLWRFQFDASYAVQGLCAVLAISDSDVETRTDGVVRVYHTSFRDFLTNSHRSNHYFVDSVEFHGILARSCLELMIRHLRIDMCSLEDPTTLNCDVEDLEKRCKLQIKEGVRYACRWFAHHLSQIPWDEKMDNALILCLQGFANRYILNWIEVLSITGELDSAVLSLREIMDWLMRSPRPHEDVLLLLRDAERLVLMCYDSIQQAALQVYYSLPYVPERVRIRTAYANELKHKFEIVHGLDEHWKLCIRSVRTGTNIRSLAISASGRLIASAGDTPGVQLWDALTGSNTGHFHGIGASSCPVMFSPSGVYVAIGYDTGAVDVWDVATGHRLLNPNQDFRNASVTVLAFSRNDVLVASGANDGTVRIWDVLTRELKLTLTYHKGPILCLLFSSDVGLIASGSDDSSVITTDVYSGKLLRRFEGHKSKVNGIAFSPNGGRIASGSEDQCVRLWDTRTGVCIRTFSGAHKKPVRQVWFTADDKHLVSACNMDVYMWETSSHRRTPQHIWSVNHYFKKLTTMFPAWYAKIAKLFTASFVGRLGEVDDGTVFHVVPSPDGRAMGCARGSSVLFLDFAAPQKSWSKLLASSSTLGEPPLFVDDSDDFATAITMTLDATMLVTSDDGGSIKIWNTSPRTNWKTFEKGFQKSTEGCWPAPDGRSFLIKPMSGLQLLAPTGTLIKDLETGGDFFGQVGAVSSPDSKYFAYWAEYAWNVDKSFSIHIYDASDGVRLKRIPTFFDITCGRFSAESDLFACTHGAGIVQVWQLPSVFDKMTVTTEHDALTALEFLPGNTMLVVGSDKGSVEIRLVENGDIVHRIACSPSKVLALAVPDDAFVVVVVGQEDGSMFVWDPSHTDIAPYRLLPEMLVASDDAADKSDPDGIVFIKFTEGHRSVCTRSLGGVVCTWDLTQCLAEYVDETRKILPDVEAAADASDVVTRPTESDDASNADAEPEFAVADEQSSDASDARLVPTDDAPCAHLVSRSGTHIVYDRYLRSTYSVDNQTGWVHRGSKRLFWLPNDLRPASPVALSAFEDRFVVVTRSRSLVFFDLRPMMGLGVM